MSDDDDGEQLGLFGDDDHDDHDDPYQPVPPPVDRLANLERWWLAHFRANGRIIHNAGERCTARARTTDPETSAAAARQVKHRAKSHAMRLLGTFLHEDRNAYEAGEAAGLPTGAWKRVSELVKAGLLMDSGVRRPGGADCDQVVWRITQAGREAWQAANGG